MPRKTGLIQGTLDMLVLRVLSRLDLHGVAIADRLEQLSQNSLRVEEGSLYPALYRMEEKGWIKGRWQTTENGQRARYYGLTKAGRKHLSAEKESWDQMISTVARVMEAS